MPSADSQPSTPNSRSTLLSTTSTAILVAMNKVIRFMKFPRVGRCRADCTGSETRHWSSLAALSAGQAPGACPSWPACKRVDQGGPLCAFKKKTMFMKDPVPPVEADAPETDVAVEATLAERLELITRLARRLFHAPIVLLSLLDE